MDLTANAVLVALALDVENNFKKEHVNFRTNKRSFISFSGDPDVASLFFVHLELQVHIKHWLCFLGGWVCLFKGA